MMDKSTRLHLLERQITRLDNRLAQLQSLNEKYVQGRFGLFVALAIGVFLIFSQVSTNAGYVAALIAIIVFNVVAYFHRRVKTSIQRHRLWRQIKQEHVARIRLDWGMIPASESAAPAGHPFALDLDLVGERSLHRLLDTAISREGSQRLLHWLLATDPQPQVIDQRRKLVQELIPLTIFRDKLLLSGYQASGAVRQVNARSLVNWLEQHASGGPSALDMTILIGLSAVNIVLLVLSTAQVIPAYWMFTMLAYIAYSLFRSRVLGDVFGQALSLRDMIENLNTIFRYLEQYHYGAKPGLKALCQPFLHAQRRPSAQLRRIGRVASGASIRGNPILWFMLNILIPWDYTVAYLFERQKRDIAQLLPQWLDVWFELEALSALANFAYLNPDYTFPVIAAEAIFSGQQLGHPLIPHTEKVCNDFALTELGTVVIITGSNMAGKSSFLRTLGVNLCLAYAGAPVNAAHMQAGLFRVFTCIKVSDSVTDGFSYFYAEVRRLKALLQALDEPDAYPLFFLIDEIFKGTNNRERIIGSTAYIRSLAGRRCVGAVSTHDLELVKLADLYPQVLNYHFREEVIEGRMAFDYLLRTGPCPTTNALKIMEIEGLPVDVL